MKQSKRYPKVSIITVVLNGERYLEQTIKSVTDQNYPDVEYIIIDGGSTDRTLNIIEKYEKYITYWVSEPDEGIYDAMNKGIKAASGDIIGIVNADDWYEPGIVEWAVEILEVSGADAVHSAMRVLQDEGESIIIPAPEDLDAFAKGMLINHPTVFARKILYDKMGLFDTQFEVAADWDLVLRWWLDDAIFYADKRPFVNFRMGGMSSIHLKKSFEEKHHIRKKHGLAKWLDYYYFLDKAKSIFSSDTLLKISLKKRARPSYGVGL